MNLDELLKTGRVKCIYDSGMLYLTKGKSYNVFGEYNDGDILVIDDSNMVAIYPSSYFEPINIASETAENDIKVDFDSSFKVGDKVYCPSMLDGIIYTVKVNSKYPSEGCKLIVINDHEYCYDFDECGSNQYDNPIVYHATEENRQALQVLHPHIEFEQPPKPLTGSDLTKGMFERGDFAVVCKCSNISELSAIASSSLGLVIEYDKGRFLDTTGHLWEFAVPCNPRTSLPLTEDVLNETI